MLYARVVDNRVVEVIKPPEGFTIEQMFHPDFVKMLMLVPDGVTPEVGWVYDGSNFSAPTPPGPPPPATLAAQAAGALAAGMQITSTSQPSLDGRYACDNDAIVQGMAQMVSIIANNVFTDGSTTYEWPDTDNARHAFTVEQFKRFVTAQGAYVGALIRITRDNAGTLPAQPTAID